MKLYLIVVRVLFVCSLSLVLGVSVEANSLSSYLEEEAEVFRQDGYSYEWIEHWLEAEGQFDMSPLQGQFDFFQKVADLEKHEGFKIFEEFPLVIVINRASKGVFRQTLTVFESGRYSKSYNVSTGSGNWVQGRGTGKRYQAVTGTGFFSPSWFSPNHHSTLWDTPMPWSVFFNGGIAIHAAARSQYPLLGQAVSGGCVRMTNTDANRIYHKIRSYGKGNIPNFRRDGSIRRTASGDFAYKQGWRTLIVVEDVEVTGLSVK